MYKSTINFENQPNMFAAGDWLFWSCEYEKAREYFQTILNKRSSLTESDLARCYKSLGAVEVELKNYDQAIKFYNQQLDILQRMRDSHNKNEGIQSCYVAIGKVYWLKFDYHQAIDYHYRALEINPSSAIYKNLANMFVTTKRFDLAWDFFQKALEIDQNQEEGSNYLKLGQTYANIGTMYQLKQDNEKAFNYFEKARETLLKKLPVTHTAIRKIEKAMRTITELPLFKMDVFAQNSIIVLWLDEHIGREENCRALKMELRQITESVKMFDSVESLRQCLPHVQNRKLFCIIQGKHAQEVVPDIIQATSSSLEPVVYVFCLHKIYLVNWACEQQCVLKGGLFDHEKNLFAKLNKDINKYVNQDPVGDKKILSPELIANFMIQLTQIFERFYQENTAIGTPIAVQ